MNNLWTRQAKKDQEAADAKQAQAARDGKQVGGKVVNNLWTRQAKKDQEAADAKQAQAARDGKVIANGVVGKALGVEVPNNMDRQRSKSEEPKGNTLKMN